MKRIAAVLLVIAFLFVGVGAASTHDDLETGPGMVGPASPIYGVEVAMDNAALSVGVATPGGVAQERAAEAHQAVENNNTQAAERAAKESATVAKRANSQQDADGIQRAMTSLEGTIATMEDRAENASTEEARQGMLTASENMEGAVANMEQARQRSQERRAQANRTARDGEQRDRPQTEGDQPDGTPAAGGST